MTLKTQWVLLALFSALPYILLGAVGAWWLYQSGWGLWWMAGAAVISLIAWPLTKRLRARSRQLEDSSPNPSDDWSPAGRRAWARVEEIARQPKNLDLPLDSPEPLFNLAREIVETVAREFHAGSRQPVFEIPVPHLLRIAELVARDLRETCSANIPGSHILTIHDLMKLRRLLRLAPTLFRVYRVASLVIDPAGALMRELSTLAQDQMLTASTDETRRWLLQFAIRRTGHYAIELYSGHLALKGVEFASYTTSRSRKGMAESQKRTELLEEEPLRILVMGQVKAGKSSLINALFGEIKAAVDVVPRTKGVDAYLLERDGIRRAIILDTAGYEDVTRSESSLEAAREEIERCDLVILVSSAQMAARDADRRLLDEVRGMYQQTPDREFPPLVVALSHIDQLRPFREWSPPYDLAHPQGQKAQTIREAVEATAGDLQVDLARVVPVCLLGGGLYNVEEALVPVMLESLPAAQRLKYLRCLREFKDEEYWSRLGKQALNVGRLIVSAGRQPLEKPTSQEPTPSGQSSGRVD